MNLFADNVTIEVLDERTENGAKAHKTVGNYCLDLFSKIGAARQVPDNITKMFYAAYGENPEVAIRILLWSRDIRGGAGERQTFKTILSTIPHELLLKLIPYVPVLGRWDDLDCLTGLPRKVAFAYWASSVSDDGLAAKWAPRQGKVAKELRSHLSLSEKDWRKLCVTNSSTVEQLMCAKKWDDIEFSHVPSVAFSRYRTAFFKHAPEKFPAFLESVKKGEKKINASALFPHDVLRGTSIYNNILSLGVQEQWNALPDFVGEGSFLPVCDVSGSMGTPVSGSVTALNVCVGMGLYLSERNKSAFKNIFATFSDKPKLQKLSGDLQTRFHALSDADWEMSTNVGAVFDLILAHAQKHNVSQEDMPQNVLIMSDMQFNECDRDGYPHDSIVKKFADAGYSAPTLVYWNLCAREGKQPATKDQAVFVSGYSPSVVKQLFKGLSSVDVMLETVMIDRYDWNA